MITLKENNNRSIQITQERQDGKINIDVIGSDGQIDYYYTISPAELVDILNKYQVDNQII